jgi:hypothetical protein
VGQAPDVPELEEYPSALCMDGVGHLLPTGDLLVGKNAWCPHIAFALGGYLRALGNDQAGTCTLPVVLDHAGCWHIARTGPASGQRGHDHAVFQGQAADLRRGQKQFEMAGGHGVSQYGG